MKKIGIFILTVILAFSMVTVNAKTPDALSKIYTNYSSTYTLSVSFENSDDIVALLEELQMPEEVNNFVDMKSLLKSLLTLDTKMNLQMNMNENFDKLEYALTADMQQTIDVNKNLNVGINTKSGMWMKLDLSTEQPVFEVVYSAPFLNKYMKIDIFELINDEAAKDEFKSYLKSVFNKEYFNSVQDFSIGLLEKYADIKTSGASCVVKIDNEALTSMLDEMMDYISGTMDDIYSETVVAQTGESDVVIPSEQVPSFKGMQLLGDKGITLKYSFTNGNISGEIMDADICIDISKIVTEVYGQEWVYNAKGIMDFAIKSEATISNMSKTKVEFPQLTEENSFSFADMMQAEQEYGYVYEEDYVYEPTYPHYYAYGETEYLPVIDGEIYVPIRDTFVSAYEDTVDIGYNNGVITLTSAYFPGFSTFTLAVNSDVAYADGQAYYTDKILKIGNTTYASAEMFEEIFGWSLYWASYDMLEYKYQYEFLTTEY